METLGILIPAAGKGERLGHDIPKPFIEVGGRSILHHTVSRLAQFEAVAEIVVACPGHWMKKSQKILEELQKNSSANFKVAEGGKTRQESVRLAFQALTSTSLVAVHDAVRPFTSVESIRSCYQKASETGAAIVAVPVRDTIKMVGNDMSIKDTPERDQLWAAQTPQIFRAALLHDAIEKAREEGFEGTDDASLVEYLGEKVFVVRGKQQNFKITYPDDLERARQILANQD